MQESLSTVGPILSFGLYVLLNIHKNVSSNIIYVTIYAQLKTQKLQNFKKQKIYLKYLTPGANVIICERFTKIRQLFFAGVGGNITAY